MCYGFRDNLHPFYIQSLCNILEQNREKFTVDPKPALFLQSDIPDNFLTKFKEIVARLTESQVEEINRNIDLYNKYRNSDYKTILEDMQKQRAEAAAQWFTLNPLKVLPKEHQMLGNN